MKIYLETSVYGSGYIQKGYDSADRTREPEALSGDEKALFTRSKARLLLANVDDTRFGFVREVETGTLDDQNRPRRINLALEGDAREVDPVLCMAAELYPAFAEAIRAATPWWGTDFSIDWEAFDALLAVAQKRPAEANREKPVALVAPEPSLDYFLKACDMDWQREDVARVVELSALQEEVEAPAEPMALPQADHASTLKAEADLAGKASEDGEVSKLWNDMKLFFYCPSPSIGWTIKQVDPATGAVKAEGQRARTNLSRESVAMLDNYGGCWMALFKSGVRQCFLVKQVKSDTVNQYGQNKTVTLIVESGKMGRAVRQLAALALLDSPTFKQRLLDCVKITASTTGFTVSKDKLQALLEPVRGRVRPKDGDPRYEDWERIVASPTPSKPYSFLVLETSLDYFNQSTGLDVSRGQIQEIIDGDVISESHPAMMLVADERDTTPESKEKAPQDRPTSSTTEFLSSPSKDNATRNPVHVEEKAVDSPGPQRAPDPTESTKSEGSLKKDSVDSINLLDYPAFKMVAVCVLVVILAIVGLLIIQRGNKDDAVVEASTPVTMEAREHEVDADGERARYTEEAKLTEDGE